LFENLGRFGKLRFSKNSFPRGHIQNSLVCVPYIKIPQNTDIIVQGIIEGPPMMIGNSLNKGPNILGGPVKKMNINKNRSPAPDFRNGF